MWPFKGYNGLEAQQLVAWHAGILLRHSEGLERALQCRRQLGEGHCQAGQQVAACGHLSEASPLGRLAEGLLACKPWHCLGLQLAECGTASK